MALKNVALKKIVATICGAAVAAVTLVPSAAAARTPAEIYGPVWAQYKSITDARKKLRAKEKKGQAMSGDEYFAMAHACQYEEPPSPSKILTALSRSACKDKVVDYLIEAGKRGTPEGFLGAAEKFGTGQAAYGYAQLAYQLAGADTVLRGDALAMLADLRPTLGNVTPLDARAQELVQQLVASGQYRTAIPAAGKAELAKALPNLKWLDFVEPAKCYWSEDADHIFSLGHKFDRSGSRAIPATIRIPNSTRTVTSRIRRTNSDYVIDVEVDFSGRWNGLTVVGTTRAFIEESDAVNSFGLRFREPVRQVVERLSAAGLPVNPDGSNKVVKKSRVDRWAGPDGGGSMTTIEEVSTVVFRRGNETVFYCDYSEDSS